MLDGIKHIQAVTISPLGPMTNRPSSNPDIVDFCSCQRPTQVHSRCFLRNLGLQAYLESQGEDLRRKQCAYHASTVDGVAPQVMARHMIY